MKKLSDKVKGSKSSRRKRLNDGDLMTFGRWKGERLGDIPDYYWLWFLKQGWAETHPDLLEYAKVVENG